GWLFFKSSLPIETAPLVSTGQSVEVSIDGIDGSTFSGTVSNVNLVADPQSRQFSIQIRLDNPEDELRPGMFGRVSIVTKEVRAKVAVPKEAVEVSEKGSTVTVIDNDMKAEVRNVETGASDGNMVEVTSGVEPGEKVVTLSFQKLRDGQTVALPQKKTGRPAKK
ncbi:MAG TPA: efflux RND transporter periplasmic adaptor subunit, partial [Fimbriimonadaceae bacterium]|nr:efflux RND transporter periplasmic adaptor subunit [Fimbriimonadaceae bacterium]